MRCVSNGYLLVADLLPQERLRVLEGQMAGGSDVKPVLKRTGSQAISDPANKRPRQSEASRKVIDLTYDSD